MKTWQTNIAGWKMNHLKMYFLLSMGIFDLLCEFQEGPSFETAFPVSHDPGDLYRGRHSENFAGWISRTPSTAWILCVCCWLVFTGAPKKSLWGWLQKRRDWAKNVEEETCN